eukprot:1160410-Pelagomonas_calceolata.AAC.10
MAPSYSTAQAPSITKSMQFASNGPRPCCPLQGCHQLDSALHMLSGCQNHIISDMKTACHNVAGRIIMKALSKSP